MGPPDSEGDSMDIHDYFALPHTPAEHSPVGELMVKVLDKNPGIGFEEARAETNRLIQRAAGRKVFSISKILTPERRAKEQMRLKGLWKRPTTTRTATEAPLGRAEARVYSLR
jgi:hypothetical protein